MLIDGRWTEDPQPARAKDENGGFVRQVSSFRHRVTPDGRPGATGAGGFAADVGRCHRPAAPVGRALEGPDDAISVSVVEPEPTRLGGRFPEGRDPVPLSDRFTEADVRLFVTLVRFDAAHHGPSRRNRRRIADLPPLQAAKLRGLGRPDMRGTVSLDAIRRGCHAARALDPTGIVPGVPELEWAA